MADPRGNGTAQREREAVGSGDVAVVESLLPQVYNELRRMAQVYMGGERTDHTLSATALVHEAYLKLAGQKSAGWSSRAEFFGVAAAAMRRILVDHARRKKAEKRGGQVQRIALDDEIAWFEQRNIDLIDLDAALDRLASLDATKSRLVELRFFAGLDMDQSADMLNLAKRTAEREWTLAKAWLRQQLTTTHRQESMRTPSAESRE